MNEQEKIEQERIEQEAKQWNENKNHDCDNLKFEYSPIKFYPEDEEKMKTMSLEEKNAYMIQLKIAGKYVVQ
jgi:hypothetical protein